MLTDLQIIPDFYKRRPVSLYNPHKASLLNHYRLTVPRIRATLEYFHYGILIASYVMMLQTRNLDRVNWFEAWFIVYTLGFGLDKVAAILEHGARASCSDPRADLTRVQAGASVSTRDASTPPVC